MDNSYTPSCTSSSTSVTSTISTYGSSVGGAHATTSHHSLAPVNSTDGSASSSSGPLDYNAAVDSSFRRHSDLYLQQQQSQNDPRTQNTGEMNFRSKQSTAGLDATSICASRYGNVSSTQSPISQPPVSPMHQSTMMYSQTQGPYYFNVPTNTVASGLTICDSGTDDTQNEDVFLNGDTATINHMSSVSVATSTVGEGNDYMQPSLQGFGQQYGNNYLNLPPCRRGSAVSNPDPLTSNQENNYPYSVNIATQQATTPTEPVPSTNNFFNTDTSVSQVPGAVPHGTGYPSNAPNQPSEQAPEDHDLIVPNLPRRSSIIKNGNRKSQNKKTVSFSSMPTEKTITTAQDCLACMQDGSEMVKVRSNSRQYFRMYSLSKDMTEIRWQPTSKKPNKAKIPISCMKEVRLGMTTEALRNREIMEFYAEECAFSIIFGDNFETMDLIATSADEANIWVTGLTCLMNANASSKGCKSPETLDELHQMRDSWLQEMFDSADPDKSGVLNENAVIQLMKKLNCNIHTEKIQQKLKELQINRGDGTRGRLNSEEFIMLFKEISTRPEIYFLLVRYATNSEFMSLEDLQMFVEAEQGEARVTKERCWEIINKYEPSSEGRTKGHLGIDGFTAYLLSEECDIFNPEHRRVCQDMMQPLCHYFIASSHNTYLMEDQLKGPSSVEGYVRALKKGCRCVELDVWDGPEDEPLVYHGRTLTSKIPFKNVIEVINTYAFISSRYPVIICLENHCSLPQQQKMARYITSIFGDRLYRDAVDESRHCLPSPEFFKERILIKAKKLTGDCTAHDDYVTDEDESSETERKKTNKRDGSIRKHKLAKELSDLVNYCVSTRFEDFQVSQQSQKYWHMCSISESQAVKMALQGPEEFVNHNKRFLSRIYPNGMRVDSSNYNPLDLWNCGCQIVSVNYQTPGLMMDLYNGWFQKNGGCGYVLKPAVMREEISYFSANTKDVLPDVTPQSLHVRIISGQNFPKPRGSGAKGDITDPYVTIEIFGIPADCAEEKTKTVNNNGYNPIFDESFEFQINLPELALVRFAVLDDEFIGDEFIGQYTIPFECMETGYRHIRLLSNTGELLENSTLFVHIAITNRRGGGKGNKRGLKRNRTRKGESISVKNTGIKCIDETFKNAVTPLKEGLELRDNVHDALISFKDICGLQPIANIKQGVRLLASRVVNSSGDQFSMTLKGTYPHLEYRGSQFLLPDLVKKAMYSFNDLVTNCRTLVENADEIIVKLNNCQTMGLQWHDDLDNLCIQSGLKGKKTTKAIENFAWNVRMLRGQSDLLRQAKKDCLEDIRQIKEAGVLMGLLKDSTNPV